MTIANDLVCYRIANRLTKSEAARVFGVDRTTYQKWEDTGRCDKIAVRMLETLEWMQELYPAVHAAYLLVYK